MENSLYLYPVDKMSNDTVVSEGSGPAGEATVNVIICSETIECV